MQTERLHLRELTPELSGQVLGMTRVEQLVFLGLENDAALDEVLVKLKKRANNEYPGSRKWHLIEQASDKVIGSAGFHNWMPEHEKAELGYQLQKSYRGNGFMTEALKRIVVFGFEEMNLHRIEAFVDPDNQPSVQIMERLTFTLEGRLREHHKTEEKIHDSLVYSMLKSEFTNFQ